MKRLIIVKNKISKYSSSLLIPESADKDFSRMLIRYGSIRNFLHHIVKSKHPILAAKPRETEAKVLYQEKGQNLRRIDFRPYEEDWERLRMLAMSQRVSMVRLFVVFLLFWDSYSVGVPTKPQKILLYQSIFTNQDKIWIKISRFII